MALEELDHRVIHRYYTSEGNSFYIVIFSPLPPSEFRYFINYLCRIGVINDAETARCLFVQVISDIIKAHRLHSYMYV